MSLFVEIYSQGKVHALFFGIADFLAPTKSDAFFLGTFPSTRSGQRKISKKSDDCFFFWSLFFTIRSGLIMLKLMLSVHGCVLCVVNCARSEDATQL